MHSIRPTIQRALAFEFELRENTITTNKGRKFPRKFPNEPTRKFFHKGNTGVELQTDTGGFMEFETDWFVKWTDLMAQIQEAQNIVGEIKAKTFTFSEEKAFKDKKLLSTGEQLVVDIKDPSFKADIQSTEGIALSQFESLLKEHEEEPQFINPLITSVDEMVDYAKKVDKKIDPAANVDNLRGLLLVIGNYIRRAQRDIFGAAKVDPVKSAFRLMHRTDFSSMFGLLSADEKALFRQIVKSEAIPMTLGIFANDQLFKVGYWGHYGGKWALFKGGKIVALATEDKQTIHDCSIKRDTPGLDKTLCGKRVPKAAITVGDWLKSIGSGKKDALSPPYGGSPSMGKGEVKASGEEKGLVAFETRGYRAPRIRTQAADKWIDFAEDVFMQAAACRPRPGATGLIYDGSKPPFDPKNCP
jgi:hypothetical protein